MRPIWFFASVAFIVTVGGAARENSLAGRGFFRLAWLIGLIIKGLQ
jgi:hypothetical protein